MCWGRSLFHEALPVVCNQGDDLIESTASYPVRAPEEDHPVGGQLMGTDPNTFAAAAREMVNAGYDVIDLNFGCPVPKVTRKGGGSALPWKSDLFDAIVAAAVRAAHLAPDAGPGLRPPLIVGAAQPRFDPPAQERLQPGHAQQRTHVAQAAQATDRGALAPSEGEPVVELQGAAVAPIARRQVALDAAPFPKICSKANYSGTKRAHSPAPISRPSVK